jgi:hypothetical protein
MKLYHTLSVTFGVKKNVLKLKSVFLILRQSVIISDADCNDFIKKRGIY